MGLFSAIYIARSNASELAKVTAPPRTVTPSAVSTAIAWVAGIGTLIGVDLLLMLMGVEEASWWLVLGVIGVSVFMGLVVKGLLDFDSQMNIHDNENKR